MFKTKVSRIAATFGLVVAALVLMGQGCKQEHPTEHPAEHPKASSGQTSLTKDELADAIQAYVDETAAKQGGYFTVTDNKTGEKLKLTLDKVHRKRLSQVGKDRYFACADFNATNGRIYDLDVFMEGTTKENLEYSDFMVHKVDGEERYTWYEENGVWKRKSEDGGSEHPAEHPKGGKEHPQEHPSEHPK